MNRLRTAGTVTTVVFSIMMTLSGLLFLAGVPKAMEGMHALGYPDYVRFILGGAKLAGVAALLLPVPWTLREWAYAGFAFDLLGAVASHLASGPPLHALQPAFALIPLTVSYVARHRAAPHVRGSGSTATGPQVLGRTAAT